MLRSRKNGLYVVGVIIELNEFEFDLLIVFLLDKTFESLDIVVDFLLKFEYLD